ncbi:hypothetical protein ACFL5M_05805 [Candidatus Neomarinimicrobiota bacterium]
MNRRNVKLTAIAVFMWSYSLWGQSGLELAGFGLATSASSDVISQGIAGFKTVPENEARWLYGAVASWQRIRGTQLHASVEATRSELGDFGRYVRVNPQNIYFLLHANRRTSFGFGIQPITRVDMGMLDIDTSFIAQDTLSYTQRRGSTGGLSALRMGYSRKIKPSVSLGIALNVIFGSLTQRDTLELQTTGTQALFTSLRADRRLEFTGKTLELSLLADITPKYKGELGILMIVPLALEAIENRTYVGQAVLNPIQQRNLQTPVSLSVGYSRKIADRQRLMSEINLARLPKEEANDLLFGRHIRATHTLRIGWSRTPGDDEVLALGRLHYRMGFYYHDYYLSGLQNDPLTEFAVSVGLGYRSPRFGHRVDLAIQWGRREGILTDAKEEKFLRISVGVTTAELWFVRPKKKWD